MQSPFFSIIIPTFQSAGTLQTAVESVLQQGFSDFEIMIVDGISKDNTITIIEEYRRKDIRVRFVSEKDAGIYDAMNKGITLSRGRYLYFLGSDDWLYDSHVLQTVFDSLGNNASDFFYGNSIMHPAEKKYDGPFTLEKLLHKNISHQAIFYRRDIFERLGRFNTRYKFHADWDFNIRCFLDPITKPEYADIVVGHFAAGGVSKQHDILFLRETILPLRLQKLVENPSSVRSLRIYDEWWRLLRNAGIRSKEEIQWSGGQGRKIPSAIRKAIRFQQLLPVGLLTFGPTSKLFMTGSYIINLLTKPG